jgi:hydroxyacylglutathione hydrolase
MIHRRPLPLVFVALFVLGAWRHLEASRTALPSFAAITALRTGSGPDQPGTFPDHWINGVGCATEPDFQVHAYNEDLFIIRQSKCAIFEAPFLYLIFGDERALLLDTGSSANLDLWGTVDGIVQRWLAKRGQSAIRLIVGHSHSHGDHYLGDPQFVGQPYVEEIAGLDLLAVKEFWGFDLFPGGTASIDLGNRVIDVLGTPGHQAASVSLYDRRTRLLMTGDIVYPGHLFFWSQPDWSAFVSSIERLAIFASENPVEWIVGCHIETRATPFAPYSWGTHMQPDEHPLQLAPEELMEILFASFSMGSTPHCEIFDEFVIHPVYLCGISWNG